MRLLRFLDIYRRTEWERKLYGERGDDQAGVFAVPSPKDNRELRVIVSSDEGWDHISVSCGDCCPTWEEMEHIKRLFFREDETAMQLHVPINEHINCHPHCLHLWRPLDKEIPRPPAYMIGPNKEAVA